MKIYNGMTELIGKTPLVRLQNIEKRTGAYAKIVAKLERANPCGSAKDRVALEMIESSEREGKLKRGGVIIEPTSGNTGIGLAAVAAVKGYRAVIVMPDTMSVERQLLIKAYGAEVVLTDGALGMAGAIEKALEIKENTEGAIIAGQFENPANPAAHRKTTGPEIWEDTDGEVDILVSAVGTGGTLTGCGEYLKEKKPDIKVIAVEPEASPLLSGGKAAAHKIQGIGANFIPEVLNRDIYDEVVTVSNEDAFLCAKDLARLEGILSGISSGAALCGAVKAACRPENKGKTVVLVLPDTGERYLSCEEFTN